MDGTDVVCILTFFIILKLMGISFFRQCPCKDDKIVKHMLWRVLNNESGAAFAKCMDEVNNGTSVMKIPAGQSMVDSPVCVPDLSAMITSLKEPLKNGI